MKQIVEKLNILQAESSSNAKAAYLQEFLEDEKFRIIVEMALDETMHYNMSSVIQGTSKKKKPEFDMLIDYLHFLSGKQGANNSEKRELASFAIDSDWETVITRIIKKDLRCGVGAKLVNKAVPGTIHIMPYMRCHTSKKLGNITFPAYAQVKEDGMFVNLFWNNSTVTYLSRNGNEFIFPEASLENEVRKYYPEVKEPMVYMGEFRVKINDACLPRKTSNGIVNKALKKNQTIYTGESRNVHFICWDVIPQSDFWEGECFLPYEQRFGNLHFFTNTKRHHLSETREINSIVEGQTWAQELLQIGEEGIVVKNFNAVWKNHTSPNQIKLKAGDLGIDNERECELKVIDWYYGKKGTKFEDCLGGLVCESEDGLLETKIGGGFKQTERGFLGLDSNLNPIIKDNLDEWIEDTYVGSIITAKFNEVIKAKTSKKHSLFSARFLEKRLDKNEADTLQYIKELL